MQLAFKEKINHPISDSSACKIGSNINFDMIKQLKKQGKLVRGYIMKNNLIAYAIQSPLWSLYQNNSICSKLFAAGFQYSRDYLYSIKDNMAKQTYDGSSFLSSRNSSKEPSQKQIDAYLRYYKAKQNLEEKSYILDMFLCAEKNINEIEKVLRKRHATVKDEIITALVQLAIYYKKDIA